MDSGLNQIFDRLGSLTAEVAALRRDIQEAEERQKAYVQKNDDSRAVLHNRIDQLVTTISDLSGRVSTVETMVNDAKSVTDKVKQWEQRGIGALFVTGLASASVSGLIVGFIAYWWEAIMRVLRA